MSQFPTRKSCGCMLNTHCMHGGPDMDELDVTTAIEGPVDVAPTIEADDLLKALKDTPPPPGAAAIMVSQTLYDQLAKAEHVKDGHLAMEGLPALKVIVHPYIPEELCRPKLPPLAELLKTDPIVRPAPKPSYRVKMPMRRGKRLKW